MIRMFILVCLLGYSQVRAQEMEPLRSQLLKLLDSKDARVGLALQRVGSDDTLSINGDARFPLQSVFKFHIAVVVLHDVDNGRLDLDQAITISENDLLPGLYSPIQDRYPDGVTLKLREILAYTVGLSDNVGCDVLLRLIGGPERVQCHFRERGYANMAIAFNEEVMQSDWNHQFRNWITPKTCNRTLLDLWANKDGWLSESSHAFFWQTMKETQTGQQRLRGRLPKETVVAHKTGYSGRHPETGVIAASNDVGIIVLPDGGAFAISVLVSDSREGPEDSEKIIAELAKACWDYFQAGE